MDLKALIAKMDQIESKQLLNEGFPTVADAKARADKEKTTGKFDKKELSTGTQYTRKSSTFDDGGKDKDQKKAEKKKKNEGINFQSSIAQMLLREFGLDERVTINPDGTTSGGIAKPPAAAAATPNPWANDPAKSAAWAKLSPADQKWLGGADPTDSAILARAPNKGKAAAAPAANTAAAAPAAAANTAADQDDADMGAAMRANAAGGNSTSAATGVGNPGEEAAAQAAADKAKAPAAAPAGAPGAQDDVTGVDAAVAAQAAATQQAASPAKPKTPPDPKVMAMQQELIKKGAKIKADGIMGPQTQAAMKQFGSASGQAAQPAAAGNPAANQTVSTAARTGVDLGAGTAGGGRGGQGGPTAAQAAQAGNPAVAKLDAEIKRFSAKNNMTIAANQKYVAGLEAKKAAASGQTAAASGQAAQPAAAASKVNPMPDPNIRTGTIAQRDEWMSKYGKTHNQDGTPKSSNQAAPLTQSIQNEDDAILERIRTALFR
jgi:hypothetical protein